MKGLLLAEITLEVEVEYSREDGEILHVKPSDPRFIPWINQERIPLDDRSRLAVEIQQEQERIAREKV